MTRAFRAKRRHALSPQGCTLSSYESHRWCFTRIEQPCAKVREEKTFFRSSCSFASLRGSPVFIFVCFVCFVVKSSPDINRLTKTPKIKKKFRQGETPYNPQKIKLSMSGTNTTHANLIVEVVPYHAAAVEIDEPRRRRRTTY